LLKPPLKKLKMTISHEPKHFSQSPLILFPSMPLHDQLDSLAELMQCLCEIQQEHYGINLMHRMIRDTLHNLAQRTRDHSPNA
jgi:hypothetical protein